MKNKLFLIQFLVIFFASVFNFVEADVKKPLWITNTAKFCPPTELCAFSEANDLETSKKLAILNLANSLKTKISGTYNSQIISNNNTIQENSTEEITQSTDLEIQGIEIKQTFESEKKFYALATLSKTKMAKNIELENEELNSKIKKIVNAPTITELLKLEPILYKKKELETTYRFLINEELQSDFKKNELSILKEKTFKKTNVYISISNDNSKQIEGFLKNFYSKNKIKISTQSNYLYKITGMLQITKEFLKIEGFEKYTFTLQLNSQKINQLGKSIIEIKLSETGRNLKQIKEKAITKIIEQLNEKIFDLELN